jgi:hypothetical protein
MADSSDPISAMPPIKAGMLGKKSRNRSGMSFNSNWTERYLTLTTSMLSYSVGPGKPPKDFIAINSSTTAENCEDKEHKQFSFLVRTPEPENQELVLSASSEHELREWLDAIKDAAAGVGEVHVKGPIALDASADSDDEAVDDISEPASAEPTEPTSEL